MKKLLTTICAAAIGFASIVKADCDITDVVEAAGKGTPELTKGTHAAAKYTVATAFKKANDNDSRVLLNDEENDITYTIASDFAPGEEMVVTQYSIRRTCGDNTYSLYRAPVSFELQGSVDGATWATIDAQSDISWGAEEMEKSFSVAAGNTGSYRFYRFRTFKTSAPASESVKCGFQYVALCGKIGVSANLDKAVLGGAFATLVNDVVPAFDAKLEFDFSFDSLSGTQGIFSNGHNDETKKFRLFFTDSKWQFDYGAQTYQNTTKPTVGARYRLVVDGPVVTLNGEELFNAGEKLTDPGSRGLSLFSAFGETVYPDKLNYPANVTVYGVKVWDGAGNLQLELHPGVALCGPRALLADKYGIRSYASRHFSDSEHIRNDFAIHPSEVNLVAKMREDSKAPTVTLGENTTLAAGSLANLFTTGFTNGDRLLLKEEATTVNFDIPADYESGKPFVLTRFVVVPCVDQWDSTLTTAAERGPAQFELQASSDDGASWTTLYAQVAKLSSEDYMQNKLGSGTAQGYCGVSFEIPEENRGSYRKYRIVTTATNRAASDTGSRWGVQELKLYGIVGVDPCYAPVEYVQNGTDEQNDNITYFRTGVVPSKADMTIELQGEFTRVDQTMGLFCCRGSSGNPWICWLVNGKLRLDYGQSGSETFAPQANVPYTITVKGNELYVNGDKKYTAGGSLFTPGSEMVLLASHTNLGGWGNQACFKLKSCRITDAFNGVVRDYVPVQNDGKYCLYDKVTDRILSAGGTASRGGEAADVDFSQRGRTVTLATELDNGALPKGPISFAFNGNQIVQGTLYAAYDNTFAGTDVAAWAKAVELGKVKNGVPTMTVTLPKNSEHYSRVKFFVRDNLGDGVSQTQSFGAGVKGLIIIVH